MLNQALRRTSGSNVHVIHASPLAAAQARWCSFIARPSPVRRTPGRTPVTWLCSARRSEVAAEEAERAADHGAVDVGRGDVAAGVADGADQLDPDHRRRRPPDLVEEVADAPLLDGVVEQADLEAGLVGLGSRLAHVVAVRRAVRYTQRTARAWRNCGPTSSANSSR